MGQIELELFEADWAAVGAEHGDHIQAWSHDGPTTPGNGQLRCAYHNRWRWQHGDHPPEDRPPDPDLQRRIAWLENWRAELRAKVLAELDE